MSSRGAVVHIKRDSYDVRIDRATPWGNPFVIGRDGNRDEVIAKYRDWVTTSTDPAPQWIRDHVHELYGKTLGCWCAPLNACHGDVLLELATIAADLEFKEAQGLSRDDLLRMLDEGTEIQ